MTEDNRTVFEETSQAFANIFEMEKEIQNLNDQLASRTDYESAEYYQIIEKVSTLSEHFYGIAETNFDAEVEKILIGLGFERERF
jgi:ATP-binding cassette, subfamily F, member 3